MKALLGRRALALLVIVCSWIASSGLARAEAPASSSVNAVDVLVGRLGGQARMFQTEVLAHLLLFRSAGSGALQQEVAREFARRIHDSGCFAYNVKLTVLGIYLRDPAYRAALVPVATELCRLWHKGQWKARIVIGGLTVAAVGLTAYSAVGVQAIRSGKSFSSFLDFDVMAVLGTTAAVDMTAVYTAWRHWKRNPEVVLFPDASRRVLEMVKDGGKPTIEELMGEAAPKAEAGDLTPDVDGLEQR